VISPEHHRRIKELPPVTIDLGPDVINDEVAVCGLCQPDKGRYHLFCRADGIDDLDRSVQREIRRIEVINHVGNAAIVIRQPEIGAEHGAFMGKDGEGSLEITTGTDLSAGMVAGGYIGPDGPFNTFMSAHCGVLG
jgi:hypothetical protein